MASSNATLIEGSHIIPKGVLEEYGDIFRDYLPGWGWAGEYNYRATAKK